MNMFFFFKIESLSVVYGTSILVTVNVLTLTVRGQTLYLKELKKLELLS